MMVERKSGKRTSGKTTGRPQERAGYDSSNNLLPATIGYLALFGQLAPVFLVGLNKAGLIKLPPINLLTDISNNAMDAAVKSGEISAFVGTAYSTGVWRDLLLDFYRNGETLDYLTRAGGVCAEHPAWCEGIEIVYRINN